MKEPSDFSGELGSIFHRFRSDKNRVVSCNGAENFRADLLVVENARDHGRRSWACKDHHEHLIHCDIQNEIPDFGIHRRGGWFSWKGIDRLPLRIDNLNCPDSF